MAIGQSEWTTLGSNTNSTIDNDTHGEQNIDVGLGVPMQVRKECHVWLHGDTGTTTKHFDWAVDGDFTVILNAAKQDLGAAPGNCTVSVQGSVTGGDDDYVQLGVNLGTTDLDNAIVSYVYNYDVSGKAPYMRIKIVQANAADNSSDPIKVVVIPH